MTSFSFTSCGKYVLSSGRDSMVSVWNLKLKNKLETTVVAYEPLETVCVLDNDGEKIKSADDLRFATAGEHGLIKIWKGAAPPIPPLRFPQNFNSGKTVEWEQPQLRKGKKMPVVDLA